MIIPGAGRRYAHWWLDRCFLYTGRMTAAKGVPQILRAWMKLADQLELDCPPLWLIGGEPHEIENMRRSTNLSALTAYETAGRIKWWGYLDSAGISTLMLKAYVLVTHSLYEPGGRIILEAMTQGIPAIATPHGFAADLIKDWHGGFLVAYGNEDALCRRMSHFALQPLLRHAMGRAAQQAASTALREWSFIDAHVRIYNYAIRRKSVVTTNVSKNIATFVATAPAPRGFGGVYPFEGETMDRSRIVTFLAQHVGLPYDELLDLPTAGGRSYLWTANCNGRRLIIKYAFSTYKRRPMWDRGYCGNAIDFQRLRVTGEILAASFSGAAKLIAADADQGLILREWLEQATFDKSSLSACAQLLSIFHKGRHPSINLESIRTRLDRDWHEMNDKEVLAELAALDADWRVESRPWHAWRPMSVRLCWRWLKLGLRRRWLSLPTGLDREITVWINEESAIAANNERGLSFGFCYGDSDPVHLRKDESGNMVLIDCERLYPGYFGQDWASLVLRILSGAANDTIATEILEHALGIAETSLCPPWLLLSWLKLITVMRLCRAHALIETEAIQYGLSRLRLVQRLTR